MLPRELFVVSSYANPVSADEKCIQLNKRSEAEAEDIRVGIKHALIVVSILQDLFYWQEWVWKNDWVSSLNQRSC